MYNLLIATAVAFVPAALAGAIFGWWAAPLPFILVWFVAVFLLARRTSAAVEAHLAPIPALLQARKIAEAEKIIEEAKVKFSRWQLLIEGQLDVQLGMLDYMQMKWIKALPKLEKGKWRNWMALVAIGAVHWRNGHKDDLAWASFAEAEGVSPKELGIYVVWSVLHARRGQHDKGSEVLTRGLIALPGNKILIDLKAKIANKETLTLDDLPEAFFQFFPEDYLEREIKKMPPGSIPGQPGARPPQQAWPQPSRASGKLARRR